jgi:hypothetical protein
LVPGTLRWVWAVPFSLDEFIGCFLTCKTIFFNGKLCSGLFQSVVPWWMRLELRKMGGGGLSCQSVLQWFPVSTGLMVLPRLFCPGYVATSVRPQLSHPVDPAIFLFFFHPYVHPKMCFKIN